MTVAGCAGMAASNNRYDVRKSKRRKCVEPATSPTDTIVSPFRRAAAH
jgi:hypothetical protein